MNDSDTHKNTSTDKVDISAWPPLKKPPNSTTLEKLYKQALKEMHKYKSLTQPNLTKNVLYLTLTVNIKTNAITPIKTGNNQKKTAKAPKLNYQTMITPNKQNRYVVLGYNNKENMEYTNDENQDNLSLPSGSRSSAHHPTSTRNTQSTIRTPAQGMPGQRNAAQTAAAANF